MQNNWQTIIEETIWEDDNNVINSNHNKLSNILMQLNDSKKQNKNQSYNSIGDELYNKIHLNQSFGVVFSQNDQKKSQRFQEEKFDDIPGPGSYQYLNNSITDSLTKGHNIKGTANGFVSNTDRFQSFTSQRYAPGPGTYHKQINNYKFSQDFQSMKKTRPHSMFMKAENINRFTQPDIFPAPNHYNPSVNQLYKNIQSSVNASFQSEKIRFDQSINNNPAPNHYQNMENQMYSRTIMKNRIKPTQNLKYSINKDDSLLEEIRQIETIKNKEIEEPYHPLQHKEKIIHNLVLDQYKDEILAKHKIQKSLSNQTPGPGRYNKYLFQDILKSQRQIVSGAVFKSETIRLDKSQVHEKVGPGYYEQPIIPKKISFFNKYDENVEKQWIPIN